MVEPRTRKPDVIEPTVLEAVHLGFKKGELQIFSDVTTRFEPKTVTAVLGPSGAGKTSLLAVLGGRASGVVSGDILANGGPVSPSLHVAKGCVVFRRAGQSESNAPLDVAHASTRPHVYGTNSAPNLVRHRSVWRHAWLKRGCRYYAALLRSPACLSHEEKLHRADRIAEKLGIVRIAHSTLHYLSGGQRKRASAAMEFLSSRPILSFDGKLQN